MTDHITYDYLTRHIVPGPRSISYFGPFILLPLALSIPRSVLTRSQSIAIFIPAITICCIQAWRDMQGVDVISMNALLWSWFMIALYDPWKDFRLVLSSKGSGKELSKNTSAEAVAMKNDFVEDTSKDPAAVKDRLVASEPTRNDLIEVSYPAQLGERLLWIGKLLASIRLDNWKIGRPSHDNQQPPAAGFKTQQLFLAHAFLCFVRGFLVIDLTRTYISYDAYFTDLSVSINSPLPFHSVLPLSPQLLRTMVIGAQAWALIGQMFYLPAAIPVLLNICGVVPDKLSPHTWPSYFGTPMAIFRYGVRGFWGTFWHQTMRWTTAGPGYAIADAFQLRHNSLIRYAIISVSAFGFSGLVHMGLVPPEPLGSTMHVNSIRLHLAGFFWLQAVAVSLEALVARICIAVGGAEVWKRGAGMSTRMLINCIWTIAWFSFSLPYLAEAARQLNYWSVWPLPISIINGLRGYGYLTWSTR